MAQAMAQVPCFAPLIVCLPRLAQRFRATGAAAAAPTVAEGSKSTAQVAAIDDDDLVQASSESTYGDGTQPPPADPAAKMRAVEFLDCGAIIAEDIVYGSGCTGATPEMPEGLDEAYEEAHREEQLPAAAAGTTEKPAPNMADTLEEAASRSSSENRTQIPSTAESDVDDLWARLWARFTSPLCELLLDIALAVGAVRENQIADMSKRPGTHVEGASSNRICTELLWFRPAETSA